MSTAVFDFSQNDWKNVKLMVYYTIVILFFHNNT